jgi:hypothetical protein
MQKSPFKFLDSYSKEDRDIFFGRDKEIDELYSRVFESRILLLYGISGTGKSSLINCGLANKFNDSDWLPVTVRRGSNINRSLNESLEKAGLTEISPTGKKSTDIVKIIRSIYLDNFKPVYLIFDQFEELFIFGSIEEKKEFINNVKKVIDSDLQCRFIFSVREEYLAGVTEFEKVIPSFLNNRMRIEKMTRHSATSVIEGPCQLNNISVEPGFPELLLEKLNPDTPEVELTWLQVYLDRVFRLASKDGRVNTLTNDFLEKAGEVKDLLGTFLEEQISHLDDPESGLVILKSFVSVKGTRQQINEEEVFEYSNTFGSNIGREEVKDLIHKFIGLRILRDKDDNGKYELRHDSLAAKIYEKITLIEKELLEVKQFLENAFVSYERRGLFLTGEDLKYIAPYEDRLFLNEKINRFITQSKKEIHRAKRRRQNALIASAAIIIAILSFFTIWAMREKSNAIEQQLIAEEQKNSALSAKEEADSARLEALISRNIAIEKENLALQAQKQSEVAKTEALLQSKYALQQKNRAEMLFITANEQAQIATEEKLRAEQERSRALAAEAQAKRLNLLSTAQNMALKSAGIEENPALSGLLAVQAFNFNKNYSGRHEDPIIYEALSKAYANLDSTRHSIFKGSPSEIWVMRTKSTGSILSADLDGRISLWSHDGTSENLNVLPHQSPINFIGADNSGEKIITQHDNNDLILWDLESGYTGNLNFRKLSGNSGLVRAAEFLNDGKYLATAGRDSSMTIWDLGEETVSGVFTLRTGSGIKAMTFCGQDSIIIAQEDGSIILWQLIENRTSPIYRSETEIVLTLAWNRVKKILVAGCSSGSLLIFSLEKWNQTEPSRFLIHESGVDLIIFSSDYSLMASSSYDKTIKFYDYHEFFELGNTVGGVKKFGSLNSRVRSMIFTNENKLGASLSDKSIRIWETSSEKLASLICSIVKRDLTIEEWSDMVGEEIPYETTCTGKPKR